MSESPARQRREPGEMTTREAVAYLNERLDSPINSKVMHSLRSLGRGPIASKRGGWLFFRRVSLDAYLTEHGTDPARWSDGISRTIIAQYRAHAGSDVDVEAFIRALDPGADDIAVSDIEQPHCPECDVVMRDAPNAWVCPSCGHLQLLDDVEMPEEFDGPDIHD